MTGRPSHSVSWVNPEDLCSVGLKQKEGDRGEMWEWRLRSGKGVGGGGGVMRLGQRGSSVGLAPQLNDEDADG